MEAAGLDVDGLHDMLARYRFRWRHEADLHAAIARVLTEAKVPFEHEEDLSQTERPDFRVLRTAVEVKVDGSLSSLTRQVHRYLGLDDVDEVLVVTTLAKHRALVPTMRGKRVRVLHLSSLW